MTRTQETPKSTNQPQEVELESVESKPPLDDLIDLLVDVLLGKPKDESLRNSPQTPVDNSPSQNGYIKQEHKYSYSPESYSGNMGVKREDILSAKPEYFSPVETQVETKVETAFSELIPEDEEVVTKGVRLIEISPNEFGKHFDKQIDDRVDYPVSVQSEETAKSDLNNHDVCDDLEKDKTSVSAGLENPTSNREVDLSQDLFDPLDALQDLLLGCKFSEFEKVTKGYLETELPRLQNQINSAEQKLQAVQDKFDDHDQIFNLLLPAMTAIINSQIAMYKQDVIASIVPIIDQIIAGKKQQDKSGMINAIADLLPGAISQHIKNSPEEVAKALAPEIAIALREQRKLDQNAIANALAPEMGKAIKEQIRLERDAMVDALYPVIGNTISKYLAEAIQNINDKVANAFSLEGVARKIKAKIKGVSEAELILKESLPFSVKAIFLIHKNSGLVISEVQAPGSYRLESEMVAGMLTAIRSFVNDCIVQIDNYSELNEIEYGDSKIILEVAGYCYLAVVITGEPTPKFIEKMRKTMGIIVLDYGEFIENFDGDHDNIPLAVHQLLENLIKFVLEEKLKRIPLALISLGVFIGLLILVPLGYFSYQEYLEKRIADKTAETLATTPELAIYKIAVSVEGEQLKLTGKVPNERLRELAENLAVYTAPNLQIDNQIIAVDVPPDPIVTAGEVERMTVVFNELPGVNIETNYSDSDRQVIISGQVRQMRDAQMIPAAFQNIPGIKSVFSTLKIDPVRIENRIYFNSGSAQLNPQDLQIITKIQEFLDQYPKLSLRIIGHTDPRGNAAANEQLALNRAIAVRDALTKQGIDPKRLEVVGQGQPPADVIPHQPFLLGRTVVFEIIDNQNQN